MWEAIKPLVDWSNSNAGFVAIALFVLTLLIGWVTGILGALRQRPILKISLLEGPSMCTTFPTGRDYKGHPAHRTAISAYITVVNVGSSPTTVERVLVGYRMPRGPFFRRHWLLQTTALRDFGVTIGENYKVYPFLIQRGFLTGAASDLYLPVGRSESGVVYFEQQESWGAFRPTARNGHVKVKIRVVDSFGRRYSSKVRIPFVSLDEARRFCPEFGNTFEELSYTKQQSKVAT